MWAVGPGSKPKIFRGRTFTAPVRGFSEKVYFFPWDFLPQSFRIVVGLQYQRVVVLGFGGLPVCPVLRRLRIPLIACELYDSSKRQLTSWNCLAEPCKELLDDWVQPVGESGDLVLDREGVPHAVGRTVDVGGALLLGFTRPFPEVPEDVDRLSDVVRSGVVPEEIVQDSDQADKAPFEYSPHSASNCSRADPVRNRETRTEVEDSDSC